MQPVYLLNRRPYREDSALIDVLSRDYGLVRLVARGLRRKKNPLSAILQPFTPIIMSWQSKTDLGTMHQAEASQCGFELSGDHLYAGFYLNELVSRLLDNSEPAPELFIHYGASISALSLLDTQFEVILRRFEHELLNYLGYGLPNMEFDNHVYFAWDGAHGLVETQQAGFIQGWHLNHIEAGEYGNEAVLRAAKHLSRQRFAPLLGDKPLKSRDVWLQMKRGNS